MGLPGGSTGIKQNCSCILNGATIGSIMRYTALFCGKEGEPPDSPIVNCNLPRRAGGPVYIYITTHKTQPIIKHRMQLRMVYWAPALEIKFTPAPFAFCICVLFLLVVFVSVVLCSSVLSGGCRSV